MEIGSTIEYSGRPLDSVESAYKSTPKRTGFMFRKGASPDHDLLSAIKHRNIGKMLKAVAEGADINTKNSEGSTALIQAVQDHNIELANMLVAMNIDVNAQDTFGWTALMYAARYGDAEMTEFLASKSNTILRNNSGETALDIASHNIPRFFEDSIKRRIYSAILQY